MSATKESERAEAVAAIYAGYRKHYEPGRGETDGSESVKDSDVSLLDGDRLYAAGLSKLAALGDLETVALLADTISEAVQAQVEGRPDAADEVWDRALRTV